MCVWTLTCFESARSALIWLQWDGCFRDTATHLETATVKYQLSCLLELLRLI